VVKSEAACRPQADRAGVARVPSAKRGVSGALTHRSLITITSLRSVICQESRAFSEVEDKKISNTLVYYNHMHLFF
jgi:hypothetical protein